MNQNPFVGMTMIDQHDADKTHDFQKTLGATYAVCSIYWETWNQLDNPWDYYDKQYALNSHYQQVWRFWGTPLDKIAKFAPQVIERYKVWAIVPCFEGNRDLDGLETTTKAFRAACPKINMIVGCGYSSYDPEFMWELVERGVLKCGNIIGAHDYEACPRPDDPKATYFHPDEVLPPWPNYTENRPNLEGRIAHLNSYTEYLRDFDGPKVMLMEYGLNYNDARDGYITGKIAKDMECPLCLSVPHQPAQKPTSLAYHNGLYNEAAQGTWSDAISRFKAAIALALFCVCLTGCTVTQISTEHWTMKRTSFLQRLEIPSVTVTTNGAVALTGYKTDGGNEAVVQITAAAVSAAVKAAK